jgi:hypothetical protein
VGAVGRLVDLDRDLEPVRDDDEVGSPAVLEEQPDALDDVQEAAYDDRRAELS